MVRRSAEKVTSLLLEVSVHKETYESREYGNADDIPLHLSFVLHSGPVLLEQSIDVIGLPFCENVRAYIIKFFNVCQDYCL